MFHSLQRNLNNKTTMNITNYCYLPNIKPATSVRICMHLCSYAEIIHMHVPWQIQVLGDFSTILLNGNIIKISIKICDVNVNKGVTYY